MKIRKLYSLKERAVKDLDKITRKDTSLIWIGIIAVLVIVFSQMGSHTPVNAWEAQAASDTMAQWEDYSQSLPDYLQFDFSAPEAKTWQIPSNVLVGAYNDYQKRWMNYAWNKWHDKEFLYMLKAENGLFNHDREHPSGNNAIGVDWGFCGTNDYWHADKINDPRFFSDPAWQLEQCYNMYKGGTVFYGLKRLQRDKHFRTKIQSHFKFKT